MTRLFFVVRTNDEGHLRLTFTSVNMLIHVQNFIKSSQAFYDRSKPFFIVFKRPFNVLTILFSSGAFYYIFINILTVRTLKNACHRIGQLRGAQIEIEHLFLKSLNIDPGTVVAKDILSIQNRYSNQD
jgi:hypothetical protein